MLLVYLLSTITLVFVLICLLDQKKSDPQPPQPKPPKPQPLFWTGDQLSTVLQYLKSKINLKSKGTEFPDGITDDVLECIVSELSRVISYKDFMNKTYEEQLSLVNRKCLLGVKGRWSDLFKKSIMKVIMGQYKNMSSVCLLCLINTAEIKYDPKEIHVYSLSQILNNLDECRHYC